jgi:hypothetical protein
MGISDIRVIPVNTAGMGISSAGPIANDAMVLSRSTVKIEMIVLKVFTVLRFLSYYY